MNLPSTSNVQPDQTIPLDRHPGPNLGVVATISVVLFLAGLSLVTVFVTNPSFPSPDAGITRIVMYFQMRPEQVRISAFLSFGSLIVLGVFVAGLVSRFRFFGVRSAWVDITLWAGFVIAVDQSLSHLCEWALTWPSVAQNTPTTLAFYYLLSGAGGPGFSVPMGLLVGSISLVGGRRKLLPKWIVWSGFVISMIGLVSWLNLLLPTFSSLPATIPLTRFPSFIWLIVVGFVLPKTLAAPSRV